MSETSRSSETKLTDDIKIKIKKAIFKAHQIELETNSSSFISDRRTLYLQWVRNEQNGNKAIDIKTFKSFFDLNKIDSPNRENTVRHFCRFFLDDTPEEWLIKQTDKNQKNIRSTYLPPEHWTGIEKIERYVDSETPLRFIRSQIESFHKNTATASSTDQGAALEVWIYEGHLDEIMNRTIKSFVEMLELGTTLKILMIDPFTKDAYKFLTRGIDRNKTRLEGKLQAGLDELLFAMFQWKKHCEQKLDGFSAKKASQIQVRFHDRVPFSRCYLVCPTSLATKSLIFPSIDYCHQSASPGYTCTHNETGLVRSFYLPGIKHIWENESSSLYTFHQKHPEYLKGENQNMIVDYQEVLEAS